MLNNKKKLITSMVSTIVIAVLIFTFYYLNKSQVYNKTLTDGNKAVASEEYDKAVTLYEEALNYKKDADISKKIELAKLLKKSKETYDTAIKQTADKNYLAAIDSFKKVDKQDSKRYPIAQSKISECLKLYVVDNLKSANDNLAGSKFDEANKCIENVLKLDANNADAKKIKDDIAKVEGEKKKAEQVSATGNSILDNAMIIILKREYPTGRYTQSSTYGYIDSDEKYGKCVRTSLQVQQVNEDSACEEKKF